MLKGEWEDHKPLSNAEEGEESFGSLQEGPQQSTGAKWVSAPSPSKTSFLPSTEETVLPCHLSPTACSTSQHSEITRMITFTCTPLNRTKQIQASLLRADWSHHSKQDSPKQRGACKNSPCTSLTHPPKSTSTWLGCGISAQLEQTRFWHLQQPLEMPNEEQMAGLGVGAVTKAKWWTADFWDTWKQAKMSPHP